MDQVKFINGPLRGKKILVEDYRRPYFALAKEKIEYIGDQNDLSLFVSAPRQVKYEWVARTETLYRDGSTSKIIYEMKAFATLA